MTQSLDQARATFAWGKTAEATPELKNLASGAPSLVMTNGLMQTLAYYKDKARPENAHGKLCDAIVAWIGPTVLGQKRPDFQSVMTELSRTDADTYMRATEEALEILKWLRQFAKARVREN